MCVRACMLKKRLVKPACNTASVHVVAINVVTRERTNACVNNSHSEAKLLGMVERCVDVPLLAPSRTNGRASSAVASTAKTTTTPTRQNVAPPFLAAVELFMFAVLRVL